jgi:hypothetical protein
MERQTVSAVAARFQDYLQLPMEAGAITPEQAYRMEVEFLARRDLPWEPGNFALNQRASLWHWVTEGVAIQ